MNTVCFIRQSHWIGEDTGMCSLDCHLSRYFNQCAAAFVRGISIAKHNNKKNVLKAHCTEDMCFSATSVIVHLSSLRRIWNTITAHKMLYFYASLLIRSLPLSYIWSTLTACRQNSISMGLSSTHSVHARVCFYASALNPFHVKDFPWLMQLLPAIALKERYA